MRLACALLAAIVLHGAPKPPLRLVWAQVAVLPPGTNGAQQNSVVIPGTGIPGVPGGGMPAIPPAPGVPGNSIQNVGNNAGGTAGGATGGGVMVPSSLRVTGTAGADPQCRVTISRTRIDVPAAGGDVELVVNARPANCATIATIAEPWIQRQQGKQSGPAHFLVQPNLQSASRSTSVVIGGQRVSIEQAGASGYRIAGSPGKLEFVVKQGKIKKQLFAVWSDQSNLVYSIATVPAAQWIRIAPAVVKNGRSQFLASIDASSLRPKRYEGAIRITAPGAVPLSIPMVVDVFPK